MSGASGQKPALGRMKPGEAIAGAVKYVQAHPGCTKYAVAQAGWGYSAASVAIERGLIRAGQDGTETAPRYRLYPAGESR